MLTRASTYLFIYEARARASTLEHVKTRIYAFSPLCVMWSAWLCVPDQKKATQLVYM